MIWETLTNRFAVSIFPNCRYGMLNGKKIF